MSLIHDDTRGSRPLMQWYILRKMRNEDFDAWLDKLASLSLDDGERTAAHVLYVDQRRTELIVEVLSSNRPYLSSDHRAFVIPFGRILSINPPPSGLAPRHSLPPDDPCREQYELFDRIALFGPIILVLVPGSLFLFIFLGSVPFGVQMASAIVYTTAVILMTFGAVRGQQPYVFACPVVQGLMWQLAKRHLCYLAILFVIETIALSLRPHLPAEWLVSSGKWMPPFSTALFILGLIPWAIQSFTNRSLLERTHLEFPVL
ncbi:MAG: hypothetical protein ABR928_05550 [Terracidiphilus sp.]